MLNFVNNSGLGQVSSLSKELNILKRIINCLSSWFPLETLNGDRLISKVDQFAEILILFAYTYFLIGYYHNLAWNKKFMS